MSRMLVIKCRVGNDNDTIRYDRRD